MFIVTSNLNEQEFNKNVILNQFSKLDNKEISHTLLREIAPNVLRLNADWFLQSKQIYAMYVYVQTNTQFRPWEITASGIFASTQTYTCA